MPTWPTAKKGRMENPKRKKLKHLRFAARIDSNVASKIASMAIRYSTANYAGIWPFMVRQFTVRTKEAE